MSKEDLIIQHIPLVDKFARLLSRRMPRHIDRSELRSVGLVGLCLAARRYDPSREVSFSTYAGWRIRGAMLDHLRSLDMRPRGKHQKEGYFMEQLDEFETVPPGETTLYDAVSALRWRDGTDDFAIREAVARLHPRVRYILWHTFWLGTTHLEVGRRLGVTEARISQIRTKALRDLRGMLEGRP